MELNESIRSRAYRCLRPIKNFQSAEQAVGNLSDEVQSKLLSDEELLGIYVNSDSDPNANLVFTTRGVYRFTESWMCLEYSQILRMHVYEDEHFTPQTADTLLFRMRDDQLIRLSISGAVIRILSGYERRFPDLWEVYRFLSRVIGRVRQEQAAKSAHDSSDVAR